MRYRAKAYAKINLFLDVLGKRSDGYHDLDTVMQNVSLFDEVSLELTDGDISVKCDNFTICDENNIAYAACRSFFEYTRINKGANIEINKRIPLAAGLGGGSADAATVLLLLNMATKANLEEQELIDLAKPLGADVPFFIVGGTARAGGIGEKLTKIAAPEMNYVLLKNGEKQSTAKMYATIDNTDYHVCSDVEQLIDSLAENNLLNTSKHIFNAFSYCWDFKALAEPFERFKPISVFLSGSGPTVCALFPECNAAKACADVLKSEGYEAYSVISVGFGMEVV